jgi:hypothetical protein
VRIQRNERGNNKTENHVPKNMGSAQRNIGKSNKGNYEPIIAKEAESGTKEQRQNEKAMETPKLVQSQHEDMNDMARPIIHVSMEVEPHIMNAKNKHHAYVEKNYTRPPDKLDVGCENMTSLQTQQELTKAKQDDGLVEPSGDMDYVNETQIGSVQQDGGAGNMFID